MPFKEDVTMNIYRSWNDILYDYEDGFKHLDYLKEEELNHLKWLIEVRKMIVKVILVVAMLGFKKGGIDHIEFKTLAQCMQAKKDLEADSDWGLTGWGGYKCTCIEVRE